MTEENKVTDQAPATEAPQAPSTPDLNLNDLTQFLLFLEIQ